LSVCVVCSYTAVAVDDVAVLRTSRQPQRIIDVARSLFHRHHHRHHHFLLDALHSSLFHVTDTLLPLIVVPDVA